jgi:hypothetical protein
MVRGCLQSLIFSRMLGFQRGISYEKAVFRRSERQGMGTIELILEKVKRLKGRPFLFF